MEGVQVGRSIKHGDMRVPRKKAGKAAKISAGHLSTKRAVGSGSKRQGSTSLSGHALSKQDAALDRSLRGSRIIILISNTPHLQAEICEAPRSPSVCTQGAPQDSSPTRCTAILFAPLRENSAAAGALTIEMHFRTVNIVRPRFQHDVVVRLAVDAKWR